MYMVLLSYGGWFAGNYAVSSFISYKYYILLNASVILERNENLLVRNKTHFAGNKTHLARNETGLARNKTRVGNLRLSGAVHVVS